MEDPRKEIKAILSDELRALSQRIKANHLRAGQKASGRTLASLRVEVDGEHGTLYGRQAFGTLETGRGPGRVPRRFEDIIRQWIIDKGIAVTEMSYKRKPSERWRPKYTPKERGLRAMAGAIAHKIRTEGTKLHREGGRSDIYSPEVRKAIDNIMNRAFGIFADDVTHINLHSNENEND